MWMGKAERFRSLAEFLKLFVSIPWRKPVHDVLLYITESCLLRGKRSNCIPWLFWKKCVTVKNLEVSYVQNTNYLDRPKGLTSCLIVCFCVIFENLLLGSIVIASAGIIQYMPLHVNVLESIII